MSYIYIGDHRNPHHRVGGRGSTRGWAMYMDVYIYIYTYVYVYAHVYMYIYVYIHSYIFGRTNQPIYRQTNRFTDSSLDREIYIDRIYSASRTDIDNIVHYMMVKT